MSEGPSRRQTIGFLIVLALLFVLALILVPRLSVVPTVDAPMPSRPASTPTPTIAAVLQVAAGCAEQSSGFLSRLDPLVAQWESERRLTDRAAQDALAGQVDKLQALYVQTQALALPACAEQPFRALLVAMEHYLAAYRGFLDELPEETIQAEFAEARAAFASYQQGVQLLRAR